MRTLPVPAQRFFATLGKDIEKPRVFSCSLGTIHKVGMLATLLRHLLPETAAVPLLSCRPYHQPHSAPLRPLLLRESGEEGVMTGHKSWEVPAGDGLERQNSSPCRV